MRIRHKAIAVLLFLSACLPPAPLLHLRGAIPADATEGEKALRARVGANLDELQALSYWYDKEAGKVHTKLRLMAVFSVMAASAAGASAGILAQPQFPDIAKPGVGAAGISLAALSGVFTMAPPAHHYALKELGYRAQARAVRTSYEAIEERCGIAAQFVANGVDPGCVGQLGVALVAARTFPEGSACFAPEAGEFGRYVARGARMGGD